jgi:hypothetical protein
MSRDYLSWDEEQELRERVRHAVISQAGNIPLTERDLADRPFIYLNDGAWGLGGQISDEFRHACLGDADYELVYKRRVWTRDAYLTMMGC